MSSQDELRTIALREFALSGYAATSLQRIAEIAGLSKSSVLYHYSSKEALLEAAVTPAIARMDGIIGALEGAPLTPEGRENFIVEFVDFLLEHRLEVHLFINQCASLEDVPVVDRATLVISRMVSFFSSTVGSTEDLVRFSIALGGAAYALVAPFSPQLDEAPADQVRAALITIVTELLAPITAAAPVSMNQG